MKTVVKGVGLSFGFPRIAYPGPGTTYYYSFHLHYVVASTADQQGLQHAAAEDQDLDRHGHPHR